MLARVETKKNCFTFYFVIKSNYAEQYTDVKISIWVEKSVGTILLRLNIYFGLFLSYMYFNL